LQIPFLTNSILCNFLSLQIQLCLSLHFPFLAKSTLCQNLPFSFHSFFLANSIPCKVRRPVIMCGEYMLVCFNSGAVSCYPASMVNFIWCSDEKNVHCISTMQHGGMKSGISQSKNSTILQLNHLASCALSSSLHRCVKVIVLGIFCGCSSKT